MSFDANLSRSRDLVRLLVGDSDPTHEQLHDDTYDALVARAIAGGASAAGAPYCAAAQAGEILLAKWKTDAGGITEKVVSKLRITRGGRDNDEQVFRNYLDGLKAKCTMLSLSRPAVLKAW